MEHIKIIQNNTLADTEEVSKEIIQKLYDLAVSGDLDASSEMKGRLHLTAGYKAQTEYLHQMFPNLIITADNYIIPFEDANMLTYLNSIGVGSNGMVTESQAAAATIVANSQNTEVTKFNELKYFTGITGSRDGWEGVRDGIIRFYNWTALEEVDISNFTTIGHVGGSAWGDTFINCTNLKKVTASDKLSRIGYYAFGNCGNLEEILGLSGNIELSDRAFTYCSKLKKTTFDNCAILFYGNKGYEAFIGCTALTSITLHNSVTTLPNSCFRDCTSLTNINADNISVFMPFCFRGCKDYILPPTSTNNVTEIGEQAFSNSGMQGDYHFPNLDVLGVGAFRDTGIESVDFSSSTFTAAETALFWNCRSLRHVIFPSSVNVVKDQCFGMCTSLEYVVFPTTSTITWEANKQYFNNVPATCIIYVDDSKVAEVTAALSGKFNGQIKGISEMPTT